MQIDAACPACPACGSADLKIAPVIHHMLCAYVGPEYDFAADARGYHCPKCRRWLQDAAHDWEVVSQSAQCLCCGREYVVNDQRSHCMT